MPARTRDLRNLVKCPVRSQRNITGRPKLTIAPRCVEMYAAQRHHPEPGETQVAQPGVAAVVDPDTEEQQAREDLQPEEQRDRKQVQRYVGVLEGTPPEPQRQLECREPHEGDRAGDEHHLERPQSVAVETRGNLIRTGRAASTVTIRQKRTKARVMSA